MSAQRAIGFDAARLPRRRMLASIPTAIIRVDSARGPGTSTVRVLNSRDAMVDADAPSGSHCYSTAAMTQAWSVTASVSRSAGVAVAGASGLVGGGWLSTLARREDALGPVIVPIAFALTGLFCLVLLFSALTRATPLECAAGAGAVLAALIVYEVIGNDGFPIAEDHGAWAVVTLMPLTGILGSVLAARLGRRLRTLLRPGTP